MSDPLSTNRALCDGNVRLSDSLTVEHNTLGPGVIGHIMRNRTWDAGTLARTDRWFHYDQVGTVISTTDGDGSAAESNWFDAFGNRLEDWETGLISLADAGTGFQSKARDGTAGLAHWGSRWYSPHLGQFLSQSTNAPFLEDKFAALDQSPMEMIDPEGEEPSSGLKKPSPWGRDQLQRAFGNGADTATTGKICDPSALDRVSTEDLRRYYKAGRENMKNIKAGVRGPVVQRVRTRAVAKVLAKRMAGKLVPVAGGAATCSEAANAIDDVITRLDDYRDEVKWKRCLEDCRASQPTGITFRNCMDRAVCK